MSTDYAEPDYDFSGSPKAVEIIEAPGFPPPRHPAEADLFARHEGVPGHVQDALTNARIVIVGAGGLGSWVALALARSGVRSLTIIDPDRYDRTNASRQLMFASDIGQPKAVALARNLADHMIAGGVLSAIAMSFQNAIQAHAVPADLLVVAVDNNGCRWAASRIARQLRIPAIYSMLSQDSMRVHTFAQGPRLQDPCLWCVLPNLDVERVAPCAAAIISAGLAAAAHVIFLTHRAMMGWPTGVERFNWRATDLTACTGDEVAFANRRPGCRMCSAP